ncbi:MAG: Tad secretion system prepilin peptidase TadV [Rhodobacteraceae bacterium HLUCCA12]|nr:MAG: Tad secretion system prepilin peptidase TadV [Rhodobacteraceae bacterium HLUCCA12]
MMAQSADAALWLLVFSAPPALWVAFSDLRAMRIPNKAVVALIGVYAVVGLIALPLPDWGWSWLNFVVVLAIGFVLSLTGGFGAGDAKFAAAMAPFVALGDLHLFMVLLAAVLLSAFVAHRLFRLIPAVRRATPGWASWQRREFPMGLALGPALIFYLGLAALYGQ